MRKDIYATQNNFFRILAGILSVLVFVVVFLMIFTVDWAGFTQGIQKYFWFRVLFAVNMLYFSFGMGMIALTGRFKFFDYVDNVRSFLKKK